MCHLVRWTHHEVFEGIVWVEREFRHLLWHIMAGFDLGAGVRYTEGIQADRENTREVPSYTLVDAALGYDFSHLGIDGLSARVNANNLLDKEYVASCYSLNYCYFGAERSVMATVTYQLR